MQCTSLCKQHVQSVLQWYSRTKQCKRQVEHISGTQVKHNNENGNTVCTTGTECKWRAIRTPPERNRNTSGTQVEDNWNKWNETWGISDGKSLCKIRWQDSDHKMCQALCTLPLPSFCFGVLSIPRLLQIV